ncbi:MAG: hypothetical protein OXG82_11005 [Gammaproteobacteria bacterium]|nr:hypothetical protein [Gammaproteobacteria bacterium]
MAVSAGEDVERFRHFMEEGVMDPSMPAATANELVGEGIFSGHGVVVEMTVRAMGEHAAYVANDFLSRHVVIPNREFAQVPGLREFLIEHWRVRNRESGHNTSDVIERETSDIGNLELDETTPEGPDSLTEGVWERIGKEVRERTPAWTSIPLILAVNWPGDLAVEQFLYEMLDSDGSPHITLTTLALLNDGKFTSEQANSFRVRELVRSDAGHVGVSLAAEGLALSRPEYALPVLIAAGAEHPAALDAVRVAVAGYTDGQLARYADELRRLVPRTLELMPEGTERDAVERLLRFAEDQAAGSEARLTP